MFQIAGNDNLKVLVQTRCGHTNLFQYFGNDLKEQHTLEPWINSPRRIVVLRHPVERMHSAIAMYESSVKVLINHYESQADKPAFIEAMRQKTPEYIDYFIENYFNVADKEAVKEHTIFLVHSQPYMHQIVDYDFEVIKFENLKDYIPPIGDPIYNPRLQSGITNQTMRTYPEFPTNRYYTETDLLKEIDLYSGFIESKKEISVDDWLALTAR